MRLIRFVPALVALLAACGAADRTASVDPYPTEGPRWSTAQEAAEAMGFAVPECDGVTYYNTQEGSAWLYGHGQDVQLTVGSSTKAPFVPASEREATQDLANWQALSVHGREAVGFQREGERVERPIPGRSDETYMLTARAWLAWVEGSAHVQLRSDVLSLDELRAYAERCVLRSPA